MLPFAPLPGRPQAWAAGDPPSLQQPLALPNQTQCAIPPFFIPGAYNVDPSRPGASNFPAAAVFPGPMAPLCCPNLPPMMQNNQAGISPVQRFQLSALQRLNQQQLALQLLMRFRGVPGNLQQPQGQLRSPGAVNRLQPGVSSLAKNLPQNSNFVGTMPNVYSLSPQTMRIQEGRVSHLNSNASSQTQVHLFEVTARVIEPKSTSKKSFLQNVLEHKRTELRCQKQPLEISLSMKTNTENTGGIVVKKRSEGKPQCAINIQPSLGDEHRQHSIKHIQKEVKKCVKARRTLRIEKKLPRGGVKGDAKLHCESNFLQQPKVLLGRRAKLAVQVTKLPRTGPSKLKVLAGTEVNRSRAQKITDKSQNKKEAELGVQVVEVPPGCRCEPKHQDSREAYNPKVPKMIGNTPNKTNRKRKRKRKEKNPSIKMVDSSRKRKERKPGIETVDSSGKREERKPGIKMVDSSGKRKEKKPVIKMVDSSKKRKEKKPSIKMVDSSGELKKTDQFPNKEVMTDNTTCRSNKRRKITRAQGSK